MSKYETLTSKGKEAYIQALEELGIFNLPQFDKEEITSKLHKYTGSDYQMVLYHIAIDMEDFGETECRQLFEGIEKAIDLKFSSATFSEDDEDEEEQSINFVVTLHDKTTKTSIETQFGWVDPLEITYTVNHIFYENDIDNDCLSIIPNEPDQIAYFTLMPMGLYISGINKGVINKNEDYLRALYDEYDSSDWDELED